MTKKFRHIFFCLCVVSIANAQIYENQQWISGDVRYKIGKDFTADIEQGFRFAELSWMNTSYTDFGLSYKINKHIKISGGYRIAFRGSWSAYEHFDNRFYLDLALNRKFGDFKISTRTRFQERFRDWHTSEMGWRPQLIWRNKIAFSYKVNDELSVHITPELFTRLNDIGKSLYVQQFRLYFGADYKLSDNLEFNIFYMNQRELATKNPEYNQVIGLGFTYDINP